MKNKNESLGSKDPRLLVNILGVRQPEAAMDEANRDERTKFEAWAIQEAMIPGCMWWDTNILFERKADGLYVNRVLESSWRAWLASKVQS